jgi:hypothetical protein
MDHLAIMCRFLGSNELISKIDEIISYGIMSGNLEIISLIGLNSDKLFPLLQIFVDKTSDLQTAAYIASYAVNVQQITGLVPKRSNNRLSRFIISYREFLNNL